LVYDSKYGGVDETSQGCVEDSEVEVDCTAGKLRRIRNAPVQVDVERAEVGYVKNWDDRKGRHGNTYSKTR
jgi:hypothetical protein